MSVRGGTLRSMIVGALAVALALAVTPTPQAYGSSSASDRPWSTDGGRTTLAPRAGSRASFSAPVTAQQHGGLANHLPPAHENMQLVGKLKLTQPFGNVVPGQIADVSVHKNAAYLMSWSPLENEADAACRRGGFFSVDISNPAEPVQKAFVPALPETYHGEGAHAIAVNTPAFKGDLLAVNNEPCGPNGVGGFDLYDVSDPAKPVTLIQGAGDKSADGSLVQDPAEVPNSNHSIFVWQDGPRAYAVTVDNTELHDVDIFDITNPRDPEFIADLDLRQLFPQILKNPANGNAIFHHDVVVKRIDGRMTMLNSYWDAGYVQLDVTDPAHPTYVTDTDFPAVEPLVTLSPPASLAPEGNAHEAEYSFDNQFILAADEDFGAARAVFQITDGPHVGSSAAGEFSFSLPIKNLPDGRLNGPTAYGGYGCSARDEIRPAATAFAGVTLAPGEEKILVVQRGPVGDPSHAFEGCRFDEKMQNAIAKGYDGILIGQRHLGNAAADGTFCGSGEPRAIRGMCISHEAMHSIFNDPPSYDLPYPAGHGPPLPGTVGARVSATTQFDGWGYAHLYDAKTSALIDDFAIPEGIDERYASGFGDLSIHELATDPETNLAYSSYYAGGLRVLRFSRASGLEEVGRFIDEGGSNFWGVEQFTDKDGNRLIAGSDRDYGLYIVKYTGPGAVLAKPPPPPPPPPPPTSKPLPSSLFSFGSLKRVTIRGGRASVTIAVPGSGKVAAYLKARIGRRMVQIAKASGTATRAGKLRLTFRVSASTRRTLSRRPTRRTSGVIRVSFVPTGGVKRTRNRALSIGMR
ncbi:MAG: hypothetical protein QOI48_4149 [Solirubrobacteraceae bacterium]|nr:hypothetical protein [Solirubrobacteraceae bacterium]